MDRKKGIFRLILIFQTISGATYVMSRIVPVHAQLNKV